MFLRCRLTLLCHFHKVAHVGTQVLQGQSVGNPLPYQDSGEDLGIEFIRNGAKFGDIFDDKWFNEHCPCLD
jgi:hypothetical protein